MAPLTILVTSLLLNRSAVWKYLIMLSQFVLHLLSSFVLRSVVRFWSVQSCFGERSIIVVEFL